MKENKNLPYSIDNMKLFVSAVTALIEQEKKDNEFADAVKKVDAMASSFKYDNSLLREALINVLESKFLPSSYSFYDAIDWLTNQIMPITDVGKKEYNCSVMLDGKRHYYNIMTPEDLYNFIWGEYEKCCEITTT